MQIKVGMYVKLHESNNCGCMNCDIACRGFLKVMEINEFDEELTLEGAGRFNLQSDWIIRKNRLENK